MPNQDSYETLVDEFHKVMSDPISLATEEDFSMAGQLPDVSREAHEDRTRRRLDLASRFEALSVDKLSNDQRRDVTLGKNWLRAVTLENDAPMQEDGVPTYNVKPIALRRFGESVLYSLSRDPRTPREVIAGLTSQLSKLGGYLLQECDRLRGNSPVSAWVDEALDDTTGFPSLIKAVKNFADERECGNFPGLESALRSAEWAVRNYDTLLREMPKRDDMSIGEANTSLLFDLRGITPSLRQMHAYASSTLESMMATLEEMKPEIARKYNIPAEAPVLKVAEELKKLFACEKGKVVETAKHFLSRAEQASYDLGLVSRMENESATIESVPPYLASMVTIAAMFTPGAFTKGERKSVFYINEFDGIERALNRLNLPTITAHELKPGHHYQFSRARSHPSRIRSWITPMDLAEGWTTFFAEELLPELGYVGTPGLEKEEKFMSIVDRLRLAARVRFVLGCMTGDRRFFNHTFDEEAPEGNLIDLSVKSYRGITGFAEARAVGDVKGFSAKTTYGALYLEGNRLMRQFLDSARRKSSNDGQPFVLKDFTGAILREGNMPLSYIEDALREKEVI